MRRLLALLTALTIASGLSAAGATPLYDEHVDAGLHKTVLFVGDSNILYGATQITAALDNRSNGYLPVFAPRGGMGIRGYKVGFCPTGYIAPCPAPDYWQIRLDAVLAVVHPDAVVVDLGINDTNTPGAPTTGGYAGYGTKIAWLLALLPAGVPVFWSGLATPIEPKALAPGCSAIDGAIARANVTVLRWYVAAYRHPEYMAIPGVNVHYSAVGYTAWSAMVLAALNAQFPDVTIFAFIAFFVVMIHLHDIAGPSDEGGQ